MYITLVLTCIIVVSRVALVKPEKARGVEDLIISAAQRGQVNTVDEPQLISLLEQIKDKEQREQTKVTVSTFIAVNQQLIIRRRSNARRFGTMTIN